MRIRLLMIVLACATLASAQPATEQDRTFTFTGNKSQQDLQEIGTLIRAVTDIRTLAVDAPQHLLSLKGTAAQVALASWIFERMDKPASPDATVHEFRMPDDPEDVVRVFFLANTPTVQQHQEVAVVVRAITETRRVLTYNGPRAIALRGTPAQMQMAEWIIKELDKPAPSPFQAAAREYRVPGKPDDMVRVHFLANTLQVQSLQEVATAVRSLTEIRRVFTYNVPRAVIIRGVPAQLDMAAWLFRELDKPADPQVLEQLRTDASPREYRTAGNDDVVRVFFLANADSVQRLQEVATQVRTISEIRRLFTYNQPRAVAMRGTSEQITTAARLISERDKP